MNTVEAEPKLDDYLMKGIVSEIFWADQSKAFAAKIGKHSSTSDLFFIEILSFYFVVLIPPFGRYFFELFE